MKVKVLFIVSFLLLSFFSFLQEKGLQAKEYQKQDEGSNKEPSKDKVSDSEKEDNFLLLVMEYGTALNIPAYEIIGRMMLEEKKNIFIYSDDVYTYKINFRGFTREVRKFVGLGDLFDKYIKYLWVNGKFCIRGIGYDKSYKKINYIRYDASKNDFFTCEISGGETIQIPMYYEVTEQLKEVPSDIKTKEKYFTFNEEETKKEFLQKIKERHSIEKRWESVDNGENLKNQELLNKQTFTKRLLEISDELGFDYKWLIKVFRMESGLNPKAVNYTTYATGLIQFMPLLLKNLGILPDNVKKNSKLTQKVKQDISYHLQTTSGEKQLEYIKRYLLPYRHKIKSFGDLYAIVFYPNMLHKPMTYQIGSEKGIAFMKKVKEGNGPVVLATERRKRRPLRADEYLTKEDFYYYAENFNTDLASTY